MAPQKKNQLAALAGSSLDPALCIPRVYLDEVPEDLKCPICFEGAVSCVTSCNHFFCFACIQCHVSSRHRQQQPIECPLCRTSISNASLDPVNAKMQTRALRLNVACYGFDNNCNFSDKLKNIADHEATCGLISVVCNYRSRGCLESAVRKDIEIHECSCRYNPDVQPCKYISLGCRVRGTTDILDKHTGRCKYRNFNKFVPCPNQNIGCKLLIRKKFKQSHELTCLFKLSDTKKKDKNYKKSMHSLQYSRQRAIATRSERRAAAAAAEGASSMKSSEHSMNHDCEEHDQFINGIIQTAAVGLAEIGISELEQAKEKIDTLQSNNYDTSKINMEQVEGALVGITEMSTACLEHCSNISNEVNSNRNEVNRSVDRQSSGNSNCEYKCCGKDCSKEAFTLRATFSAAHNVLCGSHSSLEKLRFNLDKMFPNISALNICENLRTVELYLQGMCPGMIPGFQHAVLSTYSSNAEELGLKFTGMNVV